MPRFGLVIVGGKGMTGSTVIGALGLMRYGDVQEEYGVTTSALFPSIRHLPLAGDWLPVVWDVKHEPLSSHIARYGVFGPLTGPAAERCEGTLEWAGLHTEMDYPLDPTMKSTVFVRSLRDGAIRVTEKLNHLRQNAGLEQIVVIYLGSPHSTLPSGAIEALSAEEIPDVSCHAGLMYAAGAATAGAHFVDFTPSATLDAPLLNALCLQSGSRLAGRDGSTGQTMLKASLGELLAQRGLASLAWYSTNLIGNHDGEVLANPDFATQKINDKRAAFDAIPGADKTDHRVVIEYLPHWGDRKESWDAASLRSWLDIETVELRLNWRGADSLLAAPMVLDIARLLTLATEVPGLQPHLGYFFKKPYARETVLLSERWRELVDFASSRTHQSDGNLDDR